MTQTTTSKRIVMNDLKPDRLLQTRLDMAYDRVICSGRYIGGVEVETFEQEWAEYIGTKYCIACGNGFDALQLVLRALGADGYEYVRASAKTFLATWQAIRAAGSYPAPYDMKSSIAVVVHLYGIIQTISGYHHWLVEDAAQAHGATWHGKKAGSLGTAGCWSFYPTKNLGAYGDAGAVTTDDEYVARKVRELRNYGGIQTGINSRMDPLQAAFLSAKLPFLDTWNAIRRENASIYVRELAGIPGLSLPVVPQGCVPSWHQFAIEVVQRDTLKEYLSQNGIETLIHYPVPPHKAIGTGYDLPDTEEWAAHTLSLPVAPHVTPGNVRQVCQVIERFFDA